MHYEDGPAPSLPYVAMNVVVPLAVVTPVAFFSPRPLSLGLAALMAALFLPLVMAAFTTRYSIEEGHLDVRSGFFMHARVPVGSVQGMDRVRTIPRVVGWGPSGRGYCNRFTNGVLIVTEDGNLFVSPSAPAEFMERLREARDATGIAAPVSLRKDRAVAARAVERGKAFLVLAYGAVAVVYIGLAVPLAAGRVEPNPVYGFRTPVTLADPGVWAQANVFAGWALLAAGMVTLAGCVLIFIRRRRLGFLAVALWGLALTTIPVLLATAASLLWLYRIAS